MSAPTILDTHNFAVGKVVRNSLLLGAALTMMLVIMFSWLTQEEATEQQPPTALSAAQLLSSGYLLQEQRAAVLKGRFLTQEQLAEAIALGQSSQAIMAVVVVIDPDAFGSPTECGLSFLQGELWKIECGRVTESRSPIFLMHLYEFDQRE